jgi:hypothetical protein
MIYFLVNNDYQLFDANRHAQALRDDGFEVSLILVPHSLQCEVPAGLYDSVVEFATPIKGRRWPAAWLLYFYAWTRVEMLRPAPGDVLLLYTEYELLNHFFVNRFRATGGHVVLIEDGGVGTYLPFSKIPGQVLSVREWLIAFSVRCLPGLADIQFKKINGVVFPWRPDAQIDLLCVYRYFESARRIRTVAIRDNLPVFGSALVVGRVVFLNECIYDHYQDDVTYLRGLNEICKALTAGYSEVQFKYHPRETQVWRNRIRSQVLARFPSINIIEENLPFELLLESYAPEALASYFCASLLNLSRTRIEPLYLYHLLDDLRDQPFFTQLTTLLHGWKYRFAKDWDEVRSGYISHISFSHVGTDPLTLSETLLTKLPGFDRAGPV